MSNSERPWTTTELQRDTLQLDGQTLKGDLSTLLTLTIVGHPDLRRCGEYTLVRGKTAVSRLEPTFTRTDGSSTGPIVDPFISRRATITLRAREGAVTITREQPNADVKVGGEVLGDSAVIPLEQLDQGVVLELQSRVALLLHYRNSLPSLDDLADPHVVGTSDSLRRVRQRIEAVAQTHASVLVLGDTGVGKELVAQAIHRHSTRSRARLVSVNVGALEPSVLASTLFGHVKGAFTGADRDRAGLFREADGGTLFLDEIGDAPAEVQRALLRVLETREIVPVGSDRAERVDVRLIAATDAELTPEAAEGPVRSQLLHRLAQFVVDVPPLRDRCEDIGALFLHFVRQQLAELGALDRLINDSRASTPWIGSDIVRELYLYEWPGNVRELRNAAMRSVIDSLRLPKLRLDWGVRTETTGAHARVPQRLEPVADAPSDKPLRSLGDITKSELLEALRRVDWRPVPAAELLGVSKTSIYQLIRSTPEVPESGKLTPAEIEDALHESAGDVPAAARSLCVPVRGLKVRMTVLGISP
ncbi:MAG: two-component system nitrogen regulation response regulator GlnG [Flavobacteriales bacterium]|jgi:two-component system nitrogen regulation response regulator GlnG